MKKGRERSSSLVGLCNVAYLLNGSDERAAYKLATRLGFPRWVDSSIWEHRSFLLYKEGTLCENNSWKHEATQVSVSTLRNGLES